MGKTKTIKERVAEIEKLIDRTGKKPLTIEQRVSELNGIYDSLIYRWKQCVLTGTASGTAALSYQLERARLEIEALSGSFSGYSNEYTGNTVGWNYDPKKEAELLALVPNGDS